MKSLGFWHIYLLLIVVCAPIMQVFAQLSNDTHWYVLPQSQFYFSVDEELIRYNENSWYACNVWVSNPEESFRSTGKYGVHNGVLYYEGKPIFSWVVKNQDGEYALKLIYGTYLVVNGDILFFAWEQLPSADYQTFRLLRNVPGAIDSRQVYIWSTIISWADPETFRPYPRKLEDDMAFYIDAYHTYTSTWVVLEKLVPWEHEKRAWYMSESMRLVAANLGTVVSLEFPQTTNLPSLIEKWSESIPLCVSVGSPMEQQVPSLMYVLAILVCILFLLGGLLVVRKKYVQRNR